MRKKLEIIGFIISWFAVIAQFILMMQNRNAEISETIIRFFSFFTILTNILVALFFTSKIFTIFSVFNKKGSLTAITIFILIVGLVYQIILRGIWQPKAMQLIVDELLHTIIPLYVLIYWFIFSIKEKLKFSNLRKYLFYPLIYLLFVLIRGHFSNFYPYPFLNLPEIGFEKLLLNCGLIFIFILAIMFLLIFINNKKFKY